MGDFTKKVLEFMAADRGPLPVVEEQDSEAVWSLWDEAVSEVDVQRQLRIQAIRREGVLRTRTTDATAARDLAAGAA
jgi:hypothetical protein